jgi:hypothetical protein
MVVDSLMELVSTDTLFVEISFVFIMKQISEMEEKPPRRLQVLVQKHAVERAVLEWGL